MTLYLTLFVAVIVLIGDILYETRFPKIVEVEIETTRIPQGQELRILQVSDLHNLSIPDSFLEKLNGTTPDLIAVTGDLINGTELDFDRVFRLVERLREISPHLFFVSGNNDWEHPKYQDFLLELQKRGMVILNNAATRLSVREISLNIVGVDDPSKRRDHVEQAFAGVIDDALYTVLLAHDPMIIKRMNRIKYDLLLTGHTHGGQIRLPFFGAFVAPGQGFFPKYDKGKFQRDEHAILYIDSGLGTSVLPIRFLNRSQVSLLRINGTGTHAERS